MSSIFEAATDIVYHFTHSAALKSMLENNRINMTAKIGTRSDNLDDNHFYYFSMTRSRLGGYHVKSANNGAVLITLDGQKLNQQHKINPVDYYGPEFFKHNPRGHEMEDRLFTNKPYIENAIDYIIKVDIMIQEDDYRHKIFKNIFDSIKHMKQNGIKFNLYNDAKDFLIGKKENQITVKQFIDIIKTKEEEKPFPRFKRREYILDDLYELMMAKTDTNISLKLKEFYKKYFRYYPNDGFIQIESSFHNNKTKPEVMDKFVVYMRKHGLKNVKDIMDHIVSKWDSVID